MQITKFLCLEEKFMHYNNEFFVFVLNVFTVKVRDSLMESKQYFYRKYKYFFLNYTLKNYIIIQFIKKSLFNVCLLLFRVIYEVNRI